MFGQFIIQILTLIPTYIFMKYGSLQIGFQISSLNEKRYATSALWGFRNTVISFFRLRIDVTSTLVFGFLLCETVATIWLGIILLLY